MPGLSFRQGAQAFPEPRDQIRLIANRFEWDGPISLRRLLAGVNLVPARRAFHWPLTPSSVSGWCELTVSSDGGIAWRGHVHEAGALSHHYYVFAVIKVMVTPGTPLIVGHKGTVHGTLGIGSRDDDWENVLPWPRGAELWQEFSGMPENYATITVSTGPMELLEAMVAAGITLGAGSAVQVLLL